MNIFDGMHLRADSRFVPSQGETALLCNDVSHWLGANLESTLYLEQHHLQDFRESYMPGEVSQKTSRGTKTNDQLRVQETLFL